MAEYQTLQVPPPERLKSFLERPAIDISSPHTTKVSASLQVLKLWFCAERIFSFGTYPHRTEERPWQSDTPSSVSQATKRDRPLQKGGARRLGTGLRVIAVSVVFHATGIDETKVFSLHGNV